MCSKQGIKKFGKAEWQKICAYVHIYEQCKPAKEQETNYFSRERIMLWMLNCAFILLKHLSSQVPMERNWLFHNRAIMLLCEIANAEKLNLYF